MRKVIQFPVIRIVVAVLFVGMGLILGQTLLNLLRSTLSISNTAIANVLAFVVITPITYFAYWIYVRSVEKRDMIELRGPKAAQELSLGSLLGFGLLSLIIAILWLLGFYRVNGFNFLWLTLIGILAGAFVSAFVQELIFRAVIYRITEEWLGTCDLSDYRGVAGNLVGGRDLGRPVWSHPPDKRRCDLV